MTTKPLLGLLATTLALLIPISTGEAKGSSSAGATPSEPPARVALSGTNIVSGSSSSYIPVALNSRATVSRTIRANSTKGPTEDVRISGDGRLVGIALVPDSWNGDLRKVVVAGRFARCKVPGCPAGHDALNFQFPGSYSGGEKASSKVIIPPGNYRLYLLADRKPVRVELTLHGLKGTQTLHPETQAPADLRTPPQTIVSDVASPYFAAGDQFHAGDEGLILGAIWATAAAKQDFYYGLCHFGDLSAVPPEILYGPHCEALAAASEGFTAFGSFQDERGFTVVHLASYTQSPVPASPRGDVGMGGWISSTGEMTSAGTQTLFLSADD